MHHKNIIDHQAVQKKEHATQLKYIKPDKKIIVPKIKLKLDEKIPDALIDVYISQFLS